MHEKRLIYRRMTGRGIWLLVALVLVPVWAAAAEDGNLAAGLVVSPVAVALMAGTLWIAIGWSGRERLAQVWITGDRLTVQRGDLLDRGPIFEIPLDEISSWHAHIESYGRRGLEAVSFEHGETRYTLQISGAEFFDREVLEALVWPEAGELPAPAPVSRDQAAK